MMQDMVDKYKQTKRVLRALRTLNTDRAEREVIGGMISDCEYVLEWLRTGRRPGNRRGIDPERVRPGSRQAGKGAVHPDEKGTGVLLHGGRPTFALFRSRPIARHQEGKRAMVRGIGPQKTKEL